MADRTAAEAMYPHLKSQAPQSRQQLRAANSVAAALYPNLAAQAAKPQSPIRTPADLRAWAEYIRKMP
jgi:hypothetical protein